MPLPMWYLVSGVFFSILTVAGNGMVIHLIVTRKRLRNPTNWIILSLAVADVSVGAALVLTTQYLIQQPTSNLWYSVVSFLFAASALNLCLLTLDRYIFITKPLRYGTLMTTRRVVLFIFTAWMASFLPHFIFYLKTSILSDPNDFKRFKNFDLVVFEVLPVVILTFAAGHIFYIVRQQSRRMEMQMVQLSFNPRAAGPSPEFSTQNKRNSSMKVICVAVTVFSVFSLLKIGFTLGVTITSTKKPRIVLGDYWQIADLLGIVNSFINPVAYALFKSDIKKIFRSVFRFRKRTDQKSHKFNTKETQSDDGTSFYHRFIHQKQEIDSTK